MSHQIVSGKKVSYKIVNTLKSSAGNIYDLKRWRIADEVWDGQWNSKTARMTGLWPYKVYAPGDPDDGKWLFRRVYIEHRGGDNEKGLPISFTQDMFYSLYPTTDGNPYIEKNPKH